MSEPRERLLVYLNHSDRLDLLADFKAIEAEAREEGMLRQLERSLQDEHNEPVVLGAKARGLDVEKLRQRDSQSEPDEYWTGWNDALDAVKRLSVEPGAFSDSFDGTPT